MEPRQDGISETPEIDESTPTPPAMKDDIRQLIEQLQKKNALHETKYAKLLEEQMLEHGTLMRQLVSLKEERNSIKDNMVKNLTKLTNQQHMVNKLLEKSNNRVENKHGLPISHQFHRETISLLADGIAFINNFHHIQESLGNSNDLVATPVELVDKITLCAEAVGNDVCRLKSQIFQVETLKEDIDLLLN